MLRNHRTYKQPDILTKRVRKSKTIPDQSMSIKEIIARFSRGIPIDVVQREAVYLDQSEYDFERMSRMDFAEKAEMADRIEAEAVAMEEQLKANAEASRRKQADNARQWQQAQADSGTGIESLDNTMPVDTKKVSK